MQRTLRREPHRLEQPAHADLAERHTELAADQLPDHATGPQREPKRQLARIDTHDQRVQPRDLSRAKLRRATRNRLGLQRVAATPAHLGQPPVDGVLVEPHRHRHVLRMRTRLHLLDRAHPQHLQRPVVQLAAVVVAHT